MRKFLWTVGPLFGLVLVVTPASAQGLANTSLTTQGLTGFSSGGSQTVVNTPINVNNAIAQFPGQPSSSTGLATFFHSFNVLSLPPTIGASALPLPSSFPSTSYPNGRAVPFVPIPGSIAPANISVQHISNNSN